MAIDSGGSTSAEVGISEKDLKIPVKESSPKESEKPLTPVERAVKKTLGGIDDNSKDLISAGVTEDQIQQAKKNAEARIRTEFKELEGKDPLSIIEGALEAAAQSKTEKDVAFLNKSRIEWQRSLLPINELRQLYNQSAYREGEAIQRSHALGIEVRRDEKLDWQALAIVTVLQPKWEERSGETKKLIAESDEKYTERFLRELGVMDKDETLQDFFEKHKNIPNYKFENGGNNLKPTPQGPYREMARLNRREGGYMESIDRTGEEPWIAGIPTKIAGVEARIRPFDNRVDVAMSANAIRNIRASV